jgi:CTP-dependent riboflavin kinase
LARIVAEVNSVTGTVADGLGVHHMEMSQWSGLPFRAYPGTLNVDVGLEVAADLLARMPHVHYSFNREWPFVFGTLNGVDVAVTESRAKPWQVEVLAAVRLRDLPLTNGDRVTIVLTDLREVDG